MAVAKSILAPYSVDRQDTGSQGAAERPANWGPALRPLLPLVAVALLVAACHEAATPMVGTLERDRYELVAEAAEPITEVAAVEGACVPAGGVVLRLDDRRATATLTALREERRGASARVAELLRGPRGEKIDAARADLAGAEASLEVATREWDRARDLAADGVQSAAELDVRRRVLDLARAGRDAAEAGLVELVQGTTREELDQARAAEAAAAARVEASEVTLDRLVTRAPRAACVEALPYELGERPPLGATVAVLLADGAPWARIYVPEPLRARVVPGARLELRADGVEGALTGKVRTVSSQPAFTPHFALTERDRSRLAYLAEVELVSPGVEGLPAGLPVQAALSEAEAQ
jgi:HlyD family secretion protein